MVELIPSVLEDSAPPGEVDLFRRFSMINENWIIFHSLDLAPWNRLRKTEIDFVVIIPNLGIACIEVKSQDNIRFESGRWLPESIKGSPFKQAENARYSFFRRLRDRLPEFKDVPVVSFCIFPKSRFAISENMSIRKIDFLDYGDLCSASNHDEFSKLIKNRMKVIIDSDPQIGASKVLMSQSGIDKIKKFCYPIQSFKPDKYLVSELRRDELDRALRAQQKPVMSLLKSNERVIINGPAGTGKTLIAVEQALRLSERGERVGLICFNNLVGSHVASICDKYEIPNLIVGSAYSVLVRLFDIKVPSKPSVDFWEVSVPKIVDNLIKSGQENEFILFDYLVVDEAQDIISRPFLSGSIFSLLREGFRGRYSLFGDFDYQVFNNKDLLISELEKLCHVSSPARWILDENCRNYKSIGDAAVSLSGFKSNVYSDYRRVGGGFDSYDFDSYADLNDLASKLRLIIKNLVSQGFELDDIVILTSSLSFGLSISYSLADRGMKVSQYQHGLKCLRFSTVQAFKGLESKVIFLVGLSFSEHFDSSSLFYTGLTRATEQVKVFCERNQVNKFIEISSGVNG